MNTMKKLTVSMALVLGCTFANAANWAFQPLLSGYNVLVLSNAVNNVNNSVGVGLGSTNALYTTYAGQIVHSLTNEVINGVANTNLTIADAFKYITLASDANGDINANATVWYSFGNTNLIPIATTNAAGQWFVPTLPYTTNYITGAWATVWPLAASAAPSYMYPATTNLYPAFSGTATNTVTVTLYKAPEINGSGNTTAPALIPWETTGTFSFTVTFAGSNVKTIGSTNLPTSWLQGARYVTAVVSLPANMSTNSATTGLLLNQLGILQPQP